MSAPYIPTASEGWDNLRRAVTASKAGGFIAAPVFVRDLEAALGPVETWAAAPDGLREKVLREVIETAWRDLSEVGDRTSPEEYPDMCLITLDELSEFMLRPLAALPPVSEGGLGEPVAWQVRQREGGEWVNYSGPGEPTAYRAHEMFEVRALYARQQAAPGRERGE